MRNSRYNWAMSRLKLLFFFVFFAAVFFSAAGNAEAKILLPDGAGNYSGWTGVYTNVNEYVANDGDTTVNSVSAAATQSYNLENNSDSGTVRGVRVILYAKVTGTQEELYPLLRLSGVDDSPSGAKCLGLDGSSYKYCSYYFSTKPGGGSWSASDLNGLEAGFKTVQSGAAWEDAIYKVTQMYVDVDFKNDTKKLKFHLFQKVSAVNGALDEPFSFSIGDPVDAVQSAFIEIKGLAAISAVNLRVKVDESASTPGSYDATYAINSSGRPTLFKINYDVTDYFKTFVKSAGTYSRYIHISTDNNVYLLNAKLVITYTKIIPPVITGNYPIYGELTSTTFDTAVSSGATYNSIMWKGALGTGNSGKVLFQLAVSDSSSGPFIFYGGDTCGGGDWFDPGSPNTPIELKCPTQFNNKRYFQYKVRICSSDCISAGNYTPSVSDIIVSWSP